MFAMRKQFGRKPQTLQWRENAMVEYKKLQVGDVVFVNSMSDTYHEDVPFAWVERIHKLVAAKPEVTFLLLTKRPHVAFQMAPYLIWPENLWLGVSVENKRVIPRIDMLGKIPAKHKFLSMEPLLESVWTTLTFSTCFAEFIEWAIVGGESGANRRMFDKGWALELRDLFHNSGVHFTFKQGSHRFPGRDYELDGKTYLTTPFTTGDYCDDHS
jgi:protein gp37